MLLQILVTGIIAYMPPEAKDVENLIKQIIKEFNSRDSIDIPIPIKAGILAYEFGTIHPFWK